MSACRAGSEAVTADDRRLFYRLSEVSAITGLARPTLSRYAAEGMMPSVKVGRNRLVPAAWVRELLDRAAASAPSRADARVPRCGTLTAYRRHLRRGEEPCGPCRAANADASRIRRAAAADGEGS